MKRGIIQIGLAVIIASVFAGTLLVNSVDFPSVSAKINTYVKYLEKIQEKTGKQGYLVKGIVKEKPENSEFSGYEGCLSDYRDGSGNFVGAVRSDECGHREIEESGPTPTPTATPTSTPTGTPTSTPTATPTSTPTSTPTATPTSTPTSTPTWTPTPTGEPNWCGGTCGSNYNCQGGLYCYQGYCRNPDCPGESDCGCAGSTPTPTAPPVLGVTAPPSLPKTGMDGLSVALGLLGIGGAGFAIFKKFELI